MEISTCNGKQRRSYFTCDEMSVVRVSMEFFHFHHGTSPRRTKHHNTMLSLKPRSRPYDCSSLSLSSWPSLGLLQFYDLRGWHSSVWRLPTKFIVTQTSSKGGKIDFNWNCYARDHPIRLVPLNGHSCGNQFPTRWILSRKTAP